MGEKTNAMRKLSSMKIDFREHYYVDTGAVAGVDIARVLGEDPDRVFKTLVTVGKSGAHYVFMVPVAEELDLEPTIIATRYQLEAIAAHPEKGLGHLMKWQRELLS